jgi:hypothetical protein
VRDLTLAVRDLTLAVQHFGILAQQPFLVVGDRNLVAFEKVGGHIELHIFVVIVINNHYSCKSDLQRMNFATSGFLFSHLKKNLLRDEFNISLSVFASVPKRIFIFRKIE